MPWEAREKLILKNVYLQYNLLARNLKTLTITYTINSLLKLGYNKIVLIAYNLSEKYICCYNYLIAPFAYI